MREWPSIVQWQAHKMGGKFFLRHLLFYSPMYSLPFFQQKYENGKNVSLQNANA